MSELHDSIARTRALLTAEAQRLERAALDADDSAHAVWMARVVVEAEHAEAALFAVLNASHAYLDDEDAKAVLFPNQDKAAA